MGGKHFSDTNSSETDPFEGTIAHELWRWASGSNDERQQVLACQSKLAYAVEDYLCRAFQYPNSQKSSAWWCDGAVELSIAQCSPQSFILVGAGYWAEQPSSPFYLAPFEMEFHFAGQNAANPSRVVVRFGVANSAGEIIRTACDRRTYHHVVHTRPMHDSDWAFAIELT